MIDHNANLGSVSMREKIVATGRGPHVYRMLPLKAGLGDLPGGLLMARDHAGLLVPLDAAQTLAASGDAARQTFAFDLGGPVEPGSVEVSDGEETFTDDGFGTLPGDAEIALGDTSASLGTGDGSEQTFSGELGPMVPGSVEVSDGVETFTDDGFGTLTGDAAETPGSGKVDYSTGAMSVTFKVAPLLAADVAVTYTPRSWRGAVNYSTGHVSATFHAAPADAADNVVCTYKPSLCGVLHRDTPDGAAMAEVIVLGQVARAELLVDDTAPDVARTRAMEARHLWPIG